MSNMYWLVPLLYYPAWQVDILSQIIWFCLMSNEFPSQSLKLSFYCFTLTKMKKKMLLGLRMELTSRKASADGLAPKIIHHSFISNIHVLPQTFTSICYIILILWLVIWAEETRRHVEILRMSPPAKRDCISQFVLWL